MLPANIFVYVFIETGRSKDLFEDMDKQYGEFGEASIVTVVVEEDDKEDIFVKIYETANLDKEDHGIVFSGQKIEANS